MSKCKQKLFTLIELIVVIVMIGILAAIVLPNISTIKEDSLRAAVEGNKANIQTAVDLYRLNNLGDFPTEEQPVIGEPKEVDFNLLYPDKIRNLPKTDGVTYTVDYTGKLFASLASPPENIKKEEDALRWDDVEGAVSYNIYKEETKTKGTSLQSHLVFIANVKSSEYTDVEEGVIYAVSSVDKYGNETAPLSINLSEDSKGDEDVYFKLNGIDEFVEIHSRELMELHNEGEVTYELRYFYNGNEGALIHRGLNRWIRNDEGIKIHQECQYEPYIETNHVRLSGCDRTGDIVYFSSKIGWNTISVSISKKKDFIKVFLNGELIGGKRITELIELSSRDFLILNSDFESIYLGTKGTTNDNKITTTDYFNGGISEFRIWDFALSEVELLNSWDKNLSGNEEGLVGLWKFNADSGSTVQDKASGNDAIVH